MSDPAKTNEELSTWRKLSFVCYLATILLAWEAVTMRVPSAQDIVTVEGTIVTAGWQGGKRGAFVLQLANDTRRFAVDTDFIWEKLGAPAEVEWIGRNVRLEAAISPHRWSGRTLVYSLELEGRPIYTLSEWTRRRNANRPWFAVMCLAMFALATYCYRRKRAPMAN
jgi:hypothetical protein